MSQELRVSRLGRIPLVLRGFGVANLCRKTSDFCDEFRDKETETPARNTVPAEGSFKWPLVTRLLGLPRQVATGGIGGSRAGRRARLLSTSASYPT
jgi:hypothetical protein